MRLLKFNRMQYRVFSNFAWTDNSELLDFGLVNLIYSPNGSGKSTLATILRHLKEGTPLDSGQVEMTFDDRAVHLSSSPAPADFRHLIRVFDPRYRETALNSFEGIHWAIGEEAVDAATEVTRVAQQLEVTGREVETARERATNARRAFDNFCDATATELRSLKRLIPGQERANYSVAALRDALKEMAAPSDMDPPLSGKKDTELRDLLQERTLLPPINLDRDAGPIALETLAQTVESLSEEAATVTSEVPAWVSGRQRWLADGLKFLEAADEHDCPFCGQAVPAERQRVLSANLRGEHGDFTSRVEAAQREVAAARVDLRSLALPTSDVVMAPARSRFSNAVSALRESLDVYESALEAMETRLAQIGERIAPDDRAVVIDLGNASDDWGEVLASVAEHNQLVENHTAACQGAFEVLEADLLRKALPTYEDHLRTLTSASAEKDEAEQRRRREQSELRQAEARVRRIDDAAGALNNDLVSYLGHPDLRLEVQGDGYQILRGGTPALSVSEGERTAITLLHFLRSLDDEQFDRDNGIVIIDDPVSSLDSTALHSAAAFIINAISNSDDGLPTGQVFITTHNFAFFRLLRGWARYLRKDPQGGKAVRYYSIETEFAAEGRSSAIVPMDKLLLTFNSEYQYLFFKVHSFTPGEQSMYILNLARRLLEAFLAFRVPTEVQLHLQLTELLETLPSIGSEQRHRLRILCNEGSHSALVPESEGQLAQIDEAPLAIQALKELMRDADPDHYEKMVRLVNATGSK